LKRREFFKSATGKALAAACPLILPKYKDRSFKKPKNILFIMSDDHAAQAIGCYGSHLSQVVRTTNLDRIAAEGARLDNCFCTNSICAPSRATILTGQYSHKNQVYTLRDRLDPSHPHIAKILQSAGYQIALIGKWHLKTEPSGFDYWNVLPGQGRYFNPILKHHQKGEKVYSGYATDVITDLSLEWLKRLDQNQPFLLMCHFKAPHDRWNHAERFADFYKEGDISEPPTLLDNYQHRFSRAGEVLNRLELMVQDGYFPYIEHEKVEGLDRDMIRRTVYNAFIRQYLRCAQAVDDNVGRLLDALDRLGLAEDTLVIYTSDQGVFLGEHGYFDKRFMYEESLRMPFLVRCPGEIAPGTVVSGLIENIDFAPTMLEFAGHKVPEFMQGRSFRSLLRGKAGKNWKKTVYYRYWMHMAHFGIPAHYGIRTQRYKLIYYYGLSLGMSGTERIRSWVEGSPEIKPTDPEWELFDLKKDPYEMHNVYSDPNYSGVVLRMKLLLNEKKKEVKDTDEQFPEMLDR